MLSNVFGDERFNRSIGADGLSCAVKIKAPSIPAEYTWVRKHYPGSQVVMQALTDCDGAPADELHVRTADGRSITLFFDISSFFGKGLP